MRDAVTREFVERRVQRDRIGRRERTVECAIGTHETDRADRRCGAPELHQDLAGEIGDGCLAAGSRDREHVRRLT